MKNKKLFSNEKRKPMVTRLLCFNIKFELEIFTPNAISSKARRKNNFVIIKLNLFSVAYVLPAITTHPSARPPGRPSPCRPSQKNFGNCQLVWN